MTLLKKLNMLMFSNITKEEAKDTGMVLALIFFLISYYTNNIDICLLAAFVLLVNLTIFNIYKPIAKIWLSLAHALGRLTSLIILSIIYIILIIPVGIFRRLMKFDSLSLKQWKLNELSVLKVREHSYEAKDLDDPY
jgi:hypothetical protein